MKKRLIALFLLLAMCLSLMGCIRQDVQTPTISTQPTTPTTPTEPVTPEPDPSAVSPILYKVTDKEGNVIWLFGSIHVGRENFYPLPRYVMDAYEGSDALAVEFDLIAATEDSSEILTLYYSTMYWDGTTIKDHIPQDLYEEAVQTMTDAGYYNASLDLFGPTMWTDLINEITYEKVGVNTELGIDMFFLNTAKEDGKEIQEVESLEFQFNMSLNYSPELQLLLLEEAIEESKDIDAYREGLDEMLDLWSEGDETAFNEYLDEAPEFADDEEEALYNEYNDAMVHSRNDSMTEFAEDALASGKEVFICVGAAHVLGATGMAKQLRDLGYTVELVK